MERKDGQRYNENKYIAKNCKKYRMLLVLQDYKSSLQVKHK